jgi:hypothetical protein
VLWLFAAIAVAWLPALLGADAVRSVAALFPLASLPQPYFVPEHAWLLYIWTPIVVASACILFLSPGLFLALALGAAKSVGEWVLSALALSIVVVSLAAGIVQWLMASPLQGSAFAWVVIGCSIACFIFMVMRLVKTDSLDWPMEEPHAGVTLLTMVIVPVLILIVLAPKFYWENFNGDGANAFESTRLLLFQSLPFWTPNAGEVSDFPGFTSMLFAFPGSWFIRLFGNFEASARLPILLYLPALFGAIVGIVERGRATILGISERWLIWLALIVYVFTMAFSATYNQYAADIALPAAQDTLEIVCFLGTILAFIKHDRPWQFFFVVLNYFSLPDGVPLIGFWLLAVLLIWRPRPWRQVLEVAVALLVCFLAAGVLGRILTWLNLPPPGGEYGAMALLRHFAWLQFTDWRRLAFMVVPGGILPAVALVAWKGQNQVARALTLVTIVYFMFFYLSAYIVLHYFVPGMILPLVIFWQHDWVADPRHRHIVLASAGVAGLLALWLALPANPSPDNSGRLVGAAVEDRIGGYDQIDPAVFKRSDLLYNLFPVDWDPRVPSPSYGGSALVWNYYAHQPGRSAADTNYVFQQANDPAPVGARLVIQDQGVALYVLNEKTWARHLAQRPPTPAGSPIFQIPRGIIFRSVPLTQGPPIVDVVEVVSHLGLPVDALMEKLGVKR